MRIATKPAALVEVDMTPMIDIVFQLIAFFMVITNFEQTEADERVKLPRDTLAKPPEVKVEHELVLNVGFLRDQEGDKVDPEPYVFWAGEQIRVPKFAATFEQEARLYKNRGVDPSHVTIMIRADRDLQTGLAQELMRMAQDSGFEKFGLRATQVRD